MTNFFFQESPVSTVVLCVIMRILLGIGCAYVFKVFSSVNIMTMGSAVVQNTSMVNEIYDSGFVK